MIIESFFQAFNIFGQASFLIYMCIGSIIGLVFGIIPGISGMTAMILFLPFAFKLPPADALTAMVALDAAGITGGTVTAILLNIPGQDTSAATMIDGFPMSQKGQGGRALGAALGSASLAGVASALMALALVPLVVPMVMAFASPEMVFVVLLGLACIALLGTGSMVKGMISGGIGLIISFIGLHIMTGIPRFTFGSVYLYDGVQLVPLCLGLFAVPEAIALSARGGSIAKGGVANTGMREVVEGVKDVFRYWGVWLRGVIIGWIIGIIPGIGSTSAAFIAYGQAKQASKHPERFGTGTVEGVIAPESGNNAETAGALLTTLALGIPGAAAMAVLLGGMTMVGLIPGPEMMTKHLYISLSLLLAVIASKILGGGLCFVAAPQMAKIAVIPGRILVPLILTIVFVGVFSLQEELLDVIVLLAFTVVGLIMKQYGYNRPAQLLGYIMGDLFEKYLYLAVGSFGPLFFLRPVCLVLIAFIIATAGFVPISSLFKRKKGAVRA